MNKLESVGTTSFGLKGPSVKGMCRSSIEAPVLSRCDSISAFAGGAQLARTRQS